MSRSYDPVRAELFEVTRRLFADGMIPGSSGNLSVRIPGENRFAITPTSIPFHRLTADQIPVVDDTGRIVDGSWTPSGECPMHLAVYRHREDAGAVFHTHAPYSSALALMRLPIPPILDEMVVHLGGGIEVADYGFPGTEEMADCAIRGLGDRMAVLLANHGNLVVGEDAHAAYRVAHMVERAAQILCIARSTGGAIHVLDDEIVRRERALYEARHARSRRE
jgi:L-fuculose-phosphate aldolase